MWPIELCHRQLYSASQSTMHGYLLICQPQISTHLLGQAAIINSAV